MPSIEWKAIGASVVGFSHEVDGSLCQDCHVALSLPSGWFVGVISDGAGSAPRSADGAKAICEGLVAHITSKLGSGNGLQLDIDTARTWVTTGVESVRTNLSEMSSCDSIDDFHATLLGVIAGPKGGMFFHIGDGAGLATKAEDFASFVMSPPENGEYANETYFFTQPDWHEHLRFTPFDGQFNLIALMSDGVTPFALSSGAAGPYLPFFDPLSRFLAGQRSEEGEIALAATLAKDAIRRITGDDKTLLWALRIGSNESCQRDSDDQVGRVLE
jgi:hypothetical protein